MNEQLAMFDAGSALAEHAEAIRVLGRQTVANVIEIGRRLKDAKRLAGHGGWLPWLEREFGWKEQTARNFMNVARLAAESPTVGDLNVDFRGLYLLAAPSTPPEVVEAVAERSAAGEKLSLADIEAAVKQARQEERDQARADEEALAEKLEKVQLRADAKVSAAQAELAKAQAELAQAQAKALQAAIDADAARADVKSAVAKATETAVQEQTEAIRSLRAELKAKEAAVRDEYAGKLLFTPSDLDEKVEQLLKPYRDHIDEQERQIAALRDSNKRPQQGPRIDPSKLRSCTRIRSALNGFVEASAAMTAPDLLAFERESAKVTESDPDEAADSWVKAASKARLWLDGITP